MEWMLFLQKSRAGQWVRWARCRKFAPSSEEVGEEEPAGEDERLIRGTEKLAHYIRYRMMQILSGNRSPI